MISEVDAALRALIEAEALAGSRGVDVLFDAPTKDWASRRNAPTVDVYLYDIREDLRRRERGTVSSYDGSGRVAARHLPPRHFKLSYLITAWTQRPEDEHRLLSSLLGCFVAHEAFPRELLEGGLAELGSGSRPGRRSRSPCGSARVALRAGRPGSSAPSGRRCRRCRRPPGRRSPPGPPDPPSPPRKPRRRRAAGGPA